MGFRLTIMVNFGYLVIKGLTKNLLIEMGLLSMLVSFLFHKHINMLVDDLLI